MGFINNPRIVTDGLVLHLDAANMKSYDKYENLIVGSQLGSQVLNDYSAVTTSTDTTIANPFGGNDGVLKCTHTTNAAGGYFRWGKSLSLVSGSTYTFSYYFKNGTVSNPFEQNAFYIGTFFRTPSPSNETRIPLDTDNHVGNGWYRQIHTFTPSFTGTSQVFFNQAANQSPLGSYYLYGFQLEEGSTVTDYYETTTTAKSRGGTWFNTANTSIPGAAPTAGFNQQCHWSSPGYFSINSDYDDPQPNAISASTNSSHIYHIIPAEYRMDNNTQPRSYEVLFRVTDHSKTSYGGTVFSTKSGTGCSYACNGGIEIMSGYIKGVHYNPTNNYVFLGNTYATENQWYHAVLTYNPYENPNTKMYINGALDSTFQSADWAYGSGGYLYEIGFNRKSNAPTTFCGDVANVKMYMDKALTLEEVKQNFNALRGRFGI